MKDATPPVPNVSAPTASFFTRLPIYPLPGWFAPVHTAKFLQQSDGSLISQARFPRRNPYVFLTTDPPPLFVSVIDLRCETHSWTVGDRSPSPLPGSGLADVVPRIGSACHSGQHFGRHLI